MKRLILLSLALLSLTGCASMYGGTVPEGDNAGIRFHDPVHPDGTRYRCLTQYSKTIWCENRGKVEEGPQ